MNHMKQKKGKVLMYKAVLKETWEDYMRDKNGKKGENGVYKAWNYWRGG